MFHELTVDSIRAFYERWSTIIFRFCELFVGHRDRAEKATEVAFLTYYRGGAVLDMEHVPVPLLRHALEAARSAAGSQENPAQDLRSAILRLPFEERSIFILRSVLDFDFGRIADVTGSNAEQVKRTWVQGLLHLREFLPREFFREQSQLSVPRSSEGV